MLPKPVLVAYLSNDMLHSDMSASLGMMLLYSAVEARLYVGVNNTRCTQIDHGRNIAVQQMFDSDSSHILFVDSDMSFPSQTLAHLLSHEVDIVGATYCQRRPPHAATHRNLDKSTSIPETETLPLNGLYEVGSLGCGCLLVRREVFEAIERPYFQDIWLTSEIVQSEDITFCRKAREAGFKVWCDVPLSHAVGHIGQYVYRLSDIDTVVPPQEDIAP